MQALAIRIVGLILVPLGILLTLGMMWLAQSTHWLPDKAIVLGPIITATGFGIAIFGRAMFHEDDSTPTLLGWLVLAFGIAGGVMIKEAIDDGNFRFLERTREFAEERLGKREALVSGDEVTMAMQEVNNQQAALKTLRASLKSNDAAALAHFNEQVAAYNQRNKEVRDLLARSQTQARKANELRAKLTGRWRYAYELRKSLTKSTQVKGTVTYGTNGVVSYDSVATTGGVSREITLSGTWSVEGDKLRMVVREASKYSGDEPGDVLEFRILSISDTEFRYRDLQDGVELVRYRVP